MVANFVFKPTSFVWFDLEDLWEILVAGRNKTTDRGGGEHDPPSQATKS